MNRRYIRWIVPVLIIAAIALVIWFLTRPKPVEVIVKSVDRGIVERTVANTRAGTVEACRRAKLSPSVGVHKSRARIGVVKANLARTRLVAPFNGVIAEINGELSEYVTPSPIGIATPPVVDLIDNTCFYITAPIDEVDVPKIAPGMTVRVSLDAFGDRRFPGKVRRIAPYVLDREKQARTVDVEVEFTMPEDIREMLAGYSADVEIILDVRKNTLRIPTSAVLDRDRVFVYHYGEKKIKARDFKSGISNWYYTEVISGLKPDELVVVNVDAAGIKDNAGAVISKEVR